MPPSNPQQLRSSASNSAQAAWVLTSGRVLLSGLSASLRALTFGIPTGRGAEIVPFGVGAAGSGYSYRLWLTERATLSGLITDYADLILLTTGLVTLGTKTGVDANDLVLASENIAHAITSALTNAASVPSGPGLSLEVAYNSPGTSVYSPADNTVARLLVPDLCGRYGFIFETNTAVNPGVAATNANALVRPIGSR